MFIELLRTSKTTAEYQENVRKARKWGVKFLKEHSDYGSIGEHLEALRYASLETMYRELQGIPELEVEKRKMTNSSNDTELRVRYLPRLVEGGVILLRPSHISVCMSDSKAIIVEPVERFWDRMGSRSVQRDSTSLEAVAAIKKYFGIK